MRKSKFTESQVVWILKEAESGVPVADLLRRHGISKTTFFEWRSRYAGASVADVKRLRELAARGQVRLGGSLREGRPEDVCKAGVEQFGRYHNSRAVSQDGTTLLMEDPKLTLFYANRLAGYPLSAPVPVAAGRRR